MKNNIFKTVLISSLILFLLFSITVLMIYQVLLAEQHIIDFINMEK